MKTASAARLCPAIAVLACLGAIPVRPCLAMPGPGQFGPGVALTDYDNDGDLDILMLVSRDGRVLVYRNEGDGQAFTDVTAAAMGRAVFNANGVGLTTGDVNNDGYDDFLVTFGPSPPALLDTPYRLFRNAGNGTFTEITRASGLTAYERGVLSASAAFFDYDRDSDLDLYICNYVEMTAGGDISFKDARDHFYENRGNNAQGVPQFVDVTDEKKLGWCGGRSEWTLGVTTGDYDNDGDVDLYVANDWGGYAPDFSIRDGDNCLYRNEGDGTFVNVTGVSGTRDGGWAMGVDFGDFDNDGHLDIFLANFWQDSLLRNRGDGTFESVAAGLGIVENLNSWGTSFLDYDNDGDLDILVVNGWIPNAFGQVECEGKALWENRGPQGFVDRAADSGFQDFGDARGAAVGDVNRDGWADVVVMNNTDWAHSEDCSYEVPACLVFLNRRNGTFQDVSGSAGIRPEHPALPLPAGRPLLNNNWIVFEPRGSLSNRSAIGTRITVDAGGVTQMREIHAGSYASSNEKIAHFGLGPATAIDRVTVRWPNGLLQTRDGLSANQRLNLVEETPLVLSSFTAAASSGGAAVQWTYGDAVNVLGFRLHRRVRGEETFASLTPELLPAEAGSAAFEDSDVEAGRTYEYRLEVVASNGWSTWYGPISVDVPAPSGRPRLLQNHPNPFAAVTSIPIDMGGRENGAVRIFTVEGRLVRTLAAEADRGRAVVAWDGKDETGRLQPAGVYYYRIDGDASTRRMMVVR